MECEPLKGKYLKGGFMKNLFTLKEVKSAVDFYKRYCITEEDKSGAVRLYNEHRDIYESWHKSIGELNIIDWDDMPTDLGYNSWLFNYSFSDVIE